MNYSSFREITSAKFTHSFNMAILIFQLLFDSAGGVFFPSGSGPLGSGWGHAERDKHWVQLPFDSGSSSPWAFFFLVDPGLGAPVGGMRLEINTGYSYYLTVARRPWGHT